MSHPYMIDSRKEEDIFILNIRNEYAMVGARTREPVSQVFKASSWKDRKLKKWSPEINSGRFIITGAERGSPGWQKMRMRVGERQNVKITPLPGNSHTFSSLETLWSFASHPLDQSTIMPPTLQKFVLDCSGKVFCLHTVFFLPEEKPSLNLFLMFTCKIHGTSHIFITSLTGHLVVVDYPFYSASSLHSRHHPAP